MSELKEKMFCQLLPTEKSEIDNILKWVGEGGYRKGSLIIFREGHNPAGFWQPQHLHICSNREIKEGDLVICSFYKFLGQEKDNPTYKHLTPVIGKVLRILEDSYYIQYLDESRYDAIDNSRGYSSWSKGFSQVIESSTDKSLSLPSPSLEFIEKYVEMWNAGTPIIEVMVDMEEIFNDPTEWNGKKVFEVLPKVKSNNTISITRVQEAWDDIKNSFPYTWSALAGEVFSWLKNNYSVPQQLKP